jgi:hypothetical protein
MKSVSSSVSSSRIESESGRTCRREQLDTSLEPSPRQHVLLPIKLNPCDDDLLLCHHQQSIPDDAEVRREPSRVQCRPRAPEQRALHLESGLVDHLEEWIDECEEGTEDVGCMAGRRECLEEGVVESVG